MIIDCRKRVEKYFTEEKWLKATRKYTMTPYLPLLFNKHAAHPGRLCNYLYRHLESAPQDWPDGQPQDLQASIKPTSVSKHSLGLSAEHWPATVPSAHLFFRELSKIAKVFAVSPAIFGLTHQKPGFGNRFRQYRQHPNTNFRRWPKHFLR